MQAAKTSVDTINCFNDGAKLYENLLKKKAKAGSASLVALSLAACGSSSTTTTSSSNTADTTTTTTPTVTAGSVFELIGNSGTVSFYNPGTSITITESGSTLTFASVGGINGNGSASIDDSLASGFEVPAGTTLTSTAATFDGKSASGAGTVEVTALHSTLGADLSGLSSTSVTAAFDASGTFTGDLGSAVTTVASGKTLTAAASVVSGKTISGGSVTVTGNIAATTDFTNISSTFDMNAAAPTVAVSTTLTLTAAQAATESFVNSGTVEITASSGDQSTTVTGGVVKADMGTGTDTLILGSAANVTIADEITGATTVEITADDNGTGAVFDDAGAGWTTLKINDGTSGHNVVVDLDFASANSVDRTIDASDMSETTENFTLTLDTAANVDGILTIKASAGDTKVAGGDGNDILDFGSYIVDADDEISLGDGTDTVKITALGTDGSPTDQTFDSAAVGWDKLIVQADGTTAALDSKVSIDLSGADAVAREIDATDLTDSGAHFTLELGTVGHVNGVLTVKGGAGNDTIATGDGADIITGGAGTDAITAGTGADTIDGGAGVDTYTVGTTDSVVTDGTATTAAAAGIDNVTVTDLDKFSLSNLTEALNGVNSGAAVAVTLNDGTDDSTAAELLTAIDTAIDASAAQNDVFLIVVTDSGAGGTDDLSGVYLLGLNDGTASANDTLIHILGTGVDANSTIAIAGGDVVFTI